MKVILLGKGNSINLINKDIVLSHDCIAWANIHDHIKHPDKFPDKLDYLFIRGKRFADELTNEQKKSIIDLKIKHVITTGEKAEKILDYVVEENLSKLMEGGLNASTGLIAFNYLIKLNPIKLTVVGLDLFQKDDKLYYFNNIDDNLSCEKNNVGLKQITKNNILLQSVHSPDATIIIMKKLINKNPEINFVFYTINKELKNNLEILKNVKIYHD